MVGLKSGNIFRVELTAHQRLAEPIFLWRTLGDIREWYIPQITSVGFEVD